MVFLGELEYRRQWYVRGREFREGKGNGGMMGEDCRCKAAGVSVSDVATANLVPALC